MRSFGRLLCRSQIPVVKPTRAVKLNCQTFIESFDLFTSASLAIDKDRHFHRLTVVHGHIPTDDMYQQLILVHAKEGNVDRILSLLSAYHRCASSSLTTDLVALLAQMLQENQSVLFEANKVTPTLGESVGYALFRIVQDIQTKRKGLVPLSFCIACLQLVSTVGGSSQHILDIARYALKLGGTSQQRDEMIAAAIYGLRVTKDYDGVSELAREYPDVVLNGSGMAAVYYAESLCGFGKLEEAAKQIHRLKEGNLKVAGGVRHDTLALEDVLFEHGIAVANTVEAVKALVESHVPQLAASPEVQDRYLGLAIERLVMVGLSSADVMKYVLELTVPFGAFTIHSICEAIFNTKASITSVDRSVLLSLLDSFKTGTPKASQKKTFEVNSGDCIDCVLKTLILLKDSESLLTFLNHLNDTNWIPEVSPIVFSDVWRAARDEGWWKVSAQLRLMRLLVKPLPPKSSSKTA
eukprot:PhF_6_TR40974/c0_g1_i2/m.62030